MKNSKNIWESLFKFSLVLILVLSFLQVKMKFGWDPLDRCCLPPDSILIESITLSDSVMNIEANKTQNLLAQIEPANATNQNLRWSSSDTTVAIVHPTTGRVTATGKGGDCIITAAATDDSGKSANIKIKVNKETNDSVVLVDTIIFPNSNGDITLISGSKFEIDAKAWPENATNKTLKWESNNEGIATIDNGVVTGKDVGDCTITASSTDGGGVVKSIKVHVKKDDVKVTSISLDKSNVMVKVEGKTQVHATVLPSNATNQKLHWTSNKESIATVENGTIIGKSAGDCIITVSSTDGGKASPKKINVHVQQPDKEIKVTSISLDKSNVTIYVGNRTQVYATVLPANATNKKLNWGTSNKSVASVNNGRIVGVGEGRCTITATSTDGSKIPSTVNVIVKEKDDGDDDNVIIKGNTLEAKVKFCLSYFTNSQNSFAKKKTVANKMKNLFAPNATINIIRGNVRDVKDTRRIDYWSSSSMFDKLVFVNIEETDSKGRITVLNVQEIIN